MATDPGEAIAQAAKEAARMHVGLRDAQSAFRREYVLIQLKRNRGNKCRAAKASLLHRNTYTRILNEAQ